MKTGRTRGRSAAGARRGTGSALVACVLFSTVAAVAARGQTPAAVAARGAAGAAATLGADSTEAGVARPLAVEVTRIATDRGDLVIDLEMANLIDPPTEETLARGVPVTLILDIELWRERGAWFDHLAASRHLAYKLQLDAWDEVYVVRDAEGRQEVFLDLTEARGALAERPALRIAPLATIALDASYYIVVTAALKPLTVEDVEELEGWLSGEIKSGRARDVGLLGLPKALFDVVMDMTGLGDRNDVKRTPSFRRRDVTGGD
jgi:hypothetical protein